MERRSKRKRGVGVSQDDSGLAALITKMQRQLNAIEKKLDTVLAQPSKRPFERSYSQKPSQTSYYAPRYDRGGQRSDSRGNTYTRVVCAACKKECEVPFRPTGDRPTYCRECFSKEFFRQSRSDKRRDEKRGATAQKKEPFFVRRKKRS